MSCPIDYKTYTDTLQVRLTCTHGETAAEFFWLSELITNSAAWCLCRPASAPILLQTAYRGIPIRARDAVCLGFHRLVHADCAAAVVDAVAAALNNIVQPITHRSSRALQPRVMAKTSSQPLCRCVYCRLRCRHNPAGQRNSCCAACCVQCSTTCNVIVSVLLLYSLLLRSTVPVPVSVSRPAW